MADVRAQVRELEANHDQAGAVRLCHQLLSADLTSEDRIFVLMALAKNLTALNPLGWLNQARSALNDALDLADKNPSLKAQLFVALTAVELPLRQPEQIEATIERYNLLAARRIGAADTLYRGLLAFNAAIAWEQAGQFERAETRYRFAIDCYRKYQTGAHGADVLPRIGRAFHNLAGVLLKLGRIAEARGAASETYRLSPEDAKMICLQGKLAAAEGSTETAGTLFGRALAHPTADDYTRVDIMQAWAEMEIAAGKRTIGVSRAQEAHILAMRLPYPEAAEALEELLQKAGGEE